MKFLKKLYSEMKEEKIFSSIGIALLLLIGIVLFGGLLVLLIMKFPFFCIFSFIFLGVLGYLTCIVHDLREG